MKSESHVPSAVVDYPFLIDVVYVFASLRQTAGLGQPLITSSHVPIFLELQQSYIGALVTRLQGND